MTNNFRHSFRQWHFVRRKWYDNSIKRHLWWQNLWWTIVTLLSVNKNEMKMLGWDKLRGETDLFLWEGDLTHTIRQYWSTRKPTISCMSHKLYRNFNLWEKEEKLTWLNFPFGVNENKTFYKPCWVTIISKTQQAWNDNGGQVIPKLTQT